MCWKLAVAIGLCTLVGCAGEMRDAPPSQTPPTTTTPTARGGGPRDDGRLTPSPYNSVGGTFDDTMNPDPVPQGEAPRMEQPDAKANSTKSGKKPAPNGEVR